MSLRQRLMLAFGGLLAGMAAAALFGIVQLDAALAQHTGEVRAAVAQERAVSALLSRFKTQTQEWKNVLLRGKDAQALSRHWQAFQTLEHEITTEAGTLLATLPEGEARALLARFAEAEKAMGQAYAQGLADYQAAGFDPTAGDRAVRGIDREPARLLDEAATRIAATAADTAARADAAGARAMRVSLALMGAVAVAGLVAALLFSRAVVRQLGADPAELRAIVRRVADGNLATPVAVRQGDRDSVVASMAAMQEALTRVVTAVRENSEHVAAASAQIAQGNQDLSGRTTTQAGALEETAATMEQLSTTVSHNADSARQANALAQDASAVAARGGEVVRQVVATMQGIQDSSRRIGDIIGVIDGIAFQTNILALNASVEAARAGSQGRGFAVVASEVRNLAQRSAEAARQIKALIDRSMDQVDQGSRLVEQAGETMTGIVGSIQRLTDVVAEITSASVEQSSGVRQVGDAVSQLDRATQQNAGLVAQSAAAAQSLRTQADQLVQAVAVFQLARDPLTPATPSA